MPSSRNRRAPRIQAALRCLATKACEKCGLAQGAPENVVSQCTSMRTSEGIRALDAQKALSTADALSVSGARVLAVAQRAMAPRDRYTRNDEHDLVLLGFLVFRDPPLPNVAAAVAALKADGVHLKILTGDGERVAAHLCEVLGFESSAILMGRDIEQMTDGALAAMAEETVIFARLTPAQKTRIVLMLKARGHVVGYIGDGINDAPSLRAADVVISVANAVDVARESADIILLDRGVDVLHGGIREGAEGIREPDEVSPHRDELELRQHVQHGGGRAVSRRWPLSTREACCPLRCSYDGHTNHHTEVVHLPHDRRAGRGTFR